MIDVRRPLLSSARTSPRRRALLVVAALVAAVLVPLAGPVATAQAKVPALPHAYTSAIEGLASYVGQSKCSPTPKVGTVAFANLLLRTYPNSRSLGISRACSSGGQSEHKEGRAFDWGVSVNSVRDRASVQALFTWLFKTDRFGNRYAMVRRLGIQYVIWNHRIWGAYSAGQGWRKYTGSNPHTDHVHFSLSWAGARKLTSFWNPKNFPRGGSTAPPPAPPTESGPTAPTPAPNPTDGDTHRANPEPRAPVTLAQATALLSERVVVPANRVAGGRPTHALVAGHRYLVEASGTYRFSSRAGSVADAECSLQRGSWYRDRSLRADQSWADHLDLYIDGHDLYSEADNGQSCDSGTHTYRWVYTAERSGRAPLAVWDPNSYVDNSGSLAVRLVDLDNARTSGWWNLPAAAPAGVTGPAFRGGVEYDVTVSGTWRDGSGVVADAECAQGSGGDWQRDAVPNGGFDVVQADLGWSLTPSITGVRMTPANDPNGSCDGTDHSYTFVWSPAHDQPLSLRVDDPNGRRGDTGSLRVSVRPHVAAGTGTGSGTGTPAPLHSEQVQVGAPSVNRVSTSQTFPAGTTLHLTATGVYLMRGGDDWVAGDAECTAAHSDQTWRSTRLNGVFEGQQRPLGDVAVNGAILTWRPSDGSGDCDEQNHTYSMDYTVGSTGKLSLVIADDDHSDDRGTVTVTVEPR